MIKLAVSADLVTLTEKMRNVKLHFFFLQCCIEEALLSILQFIKFSAKL